MSGGVRNFIKRCTPVATYVRVCVCARGGSQLVENITRVASFARAQQCGINTKLINKARNYVCARAAACDALHHSAIQLRVQVDIRAPTPVIINLFVVVVALVVLLICNVGHC